MSHQVAVMLFTAQVVLASGEGDKGLKTSCLLQQDFQNVPLQLSDEAADVGVHAEYLRSALVMVKELASNVTKWDTNLSKTEREALKLIKDFVDELKESALNSHGEDQREVNRSKGLIEGCARDANNALTGDVKRAKTKMQGSRLAHDTCRTSESDCQKKDDDFCGKWNLYRKSNDSPTACAGVDFKEDVKSDVAATKDAMQKCLLELQPFYSQYAECWKYGECVNKIAPFCDLNQTKFERDYCDYSTQLSGTCDHQKDCRKRHIAFRNATHKDVEANEAARKADYTTGEKVLCYFRVFESNNTNKTAILRGCDKLAVNTSHLNVTYPAIPAAQDCVVEPSQPCDNDWESTEYDAKLWKNHVTMLNCEPCQKLQALAWIPNTMESACRDNWEFSGDGLTLTLLQANSANQCIHAHATLPQSRGRWYVEIRIDALFPISRPGGQTSVLVAIGLCAGIGDQCDGWMMLYDYDTIIAPHTPVLALKPPGGQLISPYPSYASATSGRWNQGDVIGIAFDANAGTLEYYVNGVGQGEVQSFFPGFLFAGEWHIAIRDGTRGANGIVLSLLRAPEFAIPDGFTYWL